MNKVMAGIAAAQLRWVLPLASGIAILLMVGGVIFSQATPGPTDQAVMGLGIGRYGDLGGIAYMSGRRLTCLNRTEGEFIVSDCEVSIAGKILAINAIRHRENFNGGCTAIYADREWECELGWRHVHVGGFAYIPNPLELSNSQLNGLRSQYFIENQRDEFVLASIMVAAILATVAVILAVWAIIRPATSKLRFALVAGALSVVAFCGTAISWASVVQGLWD